MPTILDEQLQKLIISKSGERRNRAGLEAQILMNSKFQSDLAEARIASAESGSRKMEALRSRVQPDIVSEKEVSSLIERYLNSYGEKTKFLEGKGFPVTKPDIAAGTFSIIDYNKPAQLIDHNAIRIEGSGDGWNLFDASTIVNAIAGAFFWFPLLNFLEGGNDVKYNTQGAVFEYSFNPQDDGIYEFSTAIAGWGTYELFADDGWPDTKMASCELVANIYADPDPNYSAHLTSDKREVTLFSRSDDNIAEAGTFSCVDDVRLTIPVHNVRNIKISIALIARVSAQGDGSYAQMDWSNNIGGLFAFPLMVQRI